MAEAHDRFRRTGRSVLMRWLRVPFTDRALLLALVAAAFAPVFLVAAAAHWERSAGDQLTSRLVAAEEASTLGPVITVDALFAGDESVAAGDAVVRSAALDPRLGDPVRTMSTPRGVALRVGDRSPIGIPVRLLARPGALEALDVVAGEAGDTGGVWISEWFASRFGFGIGDTLLMESSLEPDDPGAEAAPGGGPVTELSVVGISETLWSGERIDVPPVWTDLAATGLVPTFIRPFNEPNFSLFVMDDAALARTGITGSVRWDVPVVDLPDTFGGLEDLTARIATLERSLGTDAATVSALDALSPGATRLVFESRLSSVLDEASSAVALLAQPLASAQVAAIAIGIAIMMSAGVLMVRRRHTEYRLLAGEGERWWRIGSRTAAQLAAPTLIGGSVGLVAASVVAAIAFPDASIDWLGVDWLLLAVVAVAGVLAAAVASGIAAQATLDTGRLGAGPSRRWPLVIAAGSLWYLWTQVGRSTTPGAGAIDLTVVALPLAALVTAVLVVVVVLDLVGRRVRRIATAERVGPVFFLALRRTTTEKLGGRLTVAAFGVGVGLLVFSWILAATLTRSVEVKSAVEVGGATSIELLAHPEPGVTLPPATTLLAVQDTRISPGNVAVRIVAVDTATFGEGVAWQDEYGAIVEDVLELLVTDVGFGVPAVAITGQSTPATGSFGTFQSFPYEVIGRIDALPFAAPAGVTLLVSAAEIERYEDQRPVGDAPGAPLPGVSSPVRRYRPYLATTSSFDAIQPFLSEHDLVVRDVVTRSEVIDSVDAVAARTAFSYLRLLGGIGALAALGAIALYLSMRRRSTALAGVLVRRMGLGAGKSALVTTVEVGVLASLAVVAGGVAGPALTRRLLPRFDPVQDLPPVLDVVVPPGAVLAAVGLVVAVVAVVWLAERAIVRRTPAEVLRDIG